MLNRRNFLQATLATSILQYSPKSLNAFLVKPRNTDTLVILHTNDWHSRIEPFPLDGGALQGLGGAARRMRYIQKIRQQFQHVLLLDSGDIFQGTPYFNFYKGEVEIKVMNEMRYDATTIGNHDFDGGIENLATRIKEAKFPFLSANYNVSQTPLQGKVKNHIIKQFGKYKVGIIGCSINTKGLIPDNLCSNVLYTDPILSTDHQAMILKKSLGCNLVICLSHLGLRYNTDQVSDEKLASETHYIDYILGGHTHSLLTEAIVKKNKKNNDVFIHQVGWGGTHIGRIELKINDEKKDKKTNSQVDKIF